MTTRPKPTESKMLEEVRRWRQEAFAEDQNRTPEEKDRHSAELIKQFGLSEDRNRPFRRRRDDREDATEKG